LDRVLQAWEQASSQVSRYRAKFVRWKYDDTFHRDKPQRDEGHVRYIAPDRGLYEVNRDNGRPEKWLSDGKTIYQFDFSQRLLIEYPLPPELQGQAITRGPLPFLFSAKAETLKNRYFLRLITPSNIQGQIWLEAYPRYQVDAAEYQKAQIIINTQAMRPKAVRLYSPGGKERTVHEFYDVVVNDPLHFLQGDIGRPGTPSGWNREVRNPPTGQAARPSPPGGRR
jgi:TIGR03009 family protein